MPEDRLPLMAPTDPNAFVLSLPGMTLNGTIMPDLAQDHLAIDFCQFVPSSATARVSMDTYARRLAGALDGEPVWQQRRRRVVVGHSFGGMLALHWLLRTRPKAVDGLVLVGATAGPLFDVVRLRIAHRWRVPITRWMRVWNRPVVTRSVKAVLSPSREMEGRVDFRSLKNPTDAAVDRAGWRNTDWRSMRAFRLALDGFDCRADLPRLSVPTIVLHGDRDSLFPVSVAEDLASRLPRAELRLVPNAGHALPLTHGTHVVRAVNDLLSIGNP